MASRRQRGFSLIDGLVASLIMALAVTAMFVAWAVMFRQDAATRLMGEAGQLARAEVERARLFGADNMPMGTYSATTLSATWAGSFDPTANAWVSGGTGYFDAWGNRLAGLSSTGVALSTQTALTDTNVLPSTTGYVLQVASRRKLVVTVRRTSDASLLYQTSTYLVQGGL